MGGGFDLHEGRHNNEVTIIVDDETADFIEKVLAFEGDENDPEQMADLFEELGVNKEEFLKFMENGEDLFAPHEDKEEEIAIYRKAFEILEQRQPN